MALVEVGVADEGEEGSVAVVVVVEVSTMAEEEEVTVMTVMVVAGGVVEDVVVVVVGVEVVVISLTSSQPLETGPAQTQGESSSTVSLERERECVKERGEEREVVMSCTLWGVPLVLPLMPLS